MPKPAPHVPNPQQVQAARNTLGALRAALLADDPTMAEDERLMLDTLDGEGGDAIDVLRAVLTAGIEARQMAAVAKLRIESLSARRARFEKRSETLFAAVQRTLADLGLPSLETEEALLSRKVGSRSVQIDDAALLPDAYWRQPPREIDKRAISEALKAGDVPGASFITGPETYTLKVS